MHVVVVWEYKQCVILLIPSKHLSFQLCSADPSFLRLSLAFGVFQQYYSVTMLSDRSQSEIAWIGSFQYFLVFLIGLFGGRAFDLGLFKPVRAPFSLFPI